MKRALKITNGILLVLCVAVTTVNAFQADRNGAAIVGGVIWVLPTYLTYRAADTPGGTTYKWARGLNIFGLVCCALSFAAVTITATAYGHEYFGTVVALLIVSTPFAWNIYALSKVKKSAEQEIELLPDDEPGSHAPVQEAVPAWASSKQKRSNNYVVRHWRGELSLPVSYWVNGSLLGIVLLMLFLVIGELAKEWTLRATAFVVLSMLALTIAVTVWSIVGIMRSASEHSKRGGDAGWATAAQVFTMLGAVSFAVRLATDIGPQMKEHASIAFNADSITQVNATVAMNGQSLKLQGMLGTGSFDHAKQALLAAPAVRTIVLDSPGGRLREAEQLAALVREKSLNTYVEGRCLSACTYVFLAGDDRAATPNAQIGFHPPTFAGTSVSKAGLADMLAYYRTAGISESFLTRVRNTPSNEMWYPTRDELIDNGVLTRVSLGGETTSGYTEFRSRSELALAYRSFPLMKAVDERYPGTIDRALDAAWAKVEAGAADADISAAARQVMSEIYPKLLLTADEEALQGFLEIMIKQLGAARQLGPKACSLYLEAKLDATKVFSAELVQEELRWGLNVLNNEPIAKPMPSQEEVNSAFASIWTHLPEPYLQVVAAPNDFVDQPKLRCDAMFSFYEAVSELPASSRATALRAMFQTDE
jgi:ATP-dependent protease ClpP protease subunit